MPNFLWLSRRDAPAISDAALAALLAGAAVPAGSVRELQPLAAVLAELTGWPADDELRGEAETLAAFRNQIAPRDAAHRRPARKPRSRFQPLPVKAAAAVAAVVLSLVGVASAAYARALPSGLQRLAHDIIGAPAPGPRPATGPPLVGPTAPGHSAYGLCTAWAHAKAHGTHKQRATAFARLAAAAGGPGDVSKYCATVVHPRASARPHPSATPHGSGKPTVRPSSRGSGKPTAHPTPHSSGKPTAHPTPHSSGKPTVQPTPHGSGKPTAHPTGKPPGPADQSATRRSPSRAGAR